MKKLAGKKNVVMFFCAVLVCGQAFAYDDENYSGVYMKRQLIPNKMAELCKKSAEDIVAEMESNPNIIADCINQLAAKRRSSDAETSREGLKDIRAIEAEQVLQVEGLAASSGAAVSTYYDKLSEETAEENKNAGTTNDSDATANQTNAKLAAIVDGMRGLYVEQLKSLVFSNIKNIEREALEETASVETLKNAEEQNSSGGSSQSAGSSDNGNGSSGINGGGSSGGSESGGVDTTLPGTLVGEDLAEKVYYKANGICEICTNNGGNYECRQDSCPDGTFPVSNDPNVSFVCAAGWCAKVDFRSGVENE